ncbi:hypothetical protein BB560_002806 [Smittium megazygosporum]|uniref:Acyl-CoA desaturase n=1 Tax=Smittium megazygosporum TaxID=133381 RepID=A0A2T9ZDW6_9FUNG|nr:hypothetical protein BB560_002806 [Smittium megazygosporum]
MSDIIEKPKLKPLMKPVDKRPLSERVNWANVFLVPAMPLIGIYGLFKVDLKLYTFLFAVLYGFFSGFGMTAGYHRLWSHTSYTATLPLKIFLLMAGSACFEESAISWARHHRAHHRYTDTSLDPYNALDGFIYTHIGWLFYKKQKSEAGYVSISDLKADPILLFQHNFFYPIGFFFAFIVPTFLCGVGWGDWMGGLLFASIGRVAVIHQLTYCINSITHIFGTSTFGDDQTSKDCTLVGFITFGEGYHNFHHEFPNDYGATPLFFQFDVAKWFIDVMAFFGLAYDLKTTPEDQVKKAYVHTRLKELNRIQNLSEFNVHYEKLPEYSPQEFNTQVQDYKKKWLIIENSIYDISSFIENHPGGKAIISSGIGKDMTEAFNGGVYNHHTVARNLLRQFRIGIIKA